MFIFFFSSRRRHTRWTGDWSSDVCSSDLFEHTEGQLNLLETEKQERWRKALGAMDRIRGKFGGESVEIASGMKGMYREKVHRSEERRVGKECRCWKSLVQVKI